MTEERRKRARERIEVTRTSAYGAVMSAGDREVFDLLEEAIAALDEVDNELRPILAELRDEADECRDLARRLRQENGEIPTPVKVRA